MWICRESVWVWSVRDTNLISPVICHYKWSLACFLSPDFKHPPVSARHNQFINPDRPEGSQLNLCGCLFMSPSCVSMCVYFQYCDCAQDIRALPWTESSPAVHGSFFCFSIKKWIAQPAPLRSPPSEITRKHWNETMFCRERRKNPLMLKIYQENVATRNTSNE